MNLNENISHIKVLTLINEYHLLRRRITPKNLERAFQNSLHTTSNLALRKTFKKLIPAESFKKAVINNLIIDLGYHLNLTSIDNNDDEFEKLFNDLDNIYQTRIYSYYHDFVRNNKLK